MERTQDIGVIFQPLCEKIYTMIEPGIRCLPVCFLVFVLLMVLCFEIERKGKHLYRKSIRITIPLLGFYLCFLFQYTIFIRPFGEIREIDLVPFNTPGGFWYIVIYGLSNGVLFIPLGVLLPITWNKIYNLRRCILVGFLTSTTIEVTQLIFGCGVFQTEDMIMNTLGTALGFLFFSSWRNLHSI